MIRSRSTAQALRASISWRGYYNSSAEETLQEFTVSIELVRFGTGAPEIKKILLNRMHVFREWWVVLFNVSQFVCIMNYGGFSHCLLITLSVICERYAIGCDIIIKTRDVATIIFARARVAQQSINLGLTWLMNQASMILLHKNLCL